MKLKALKNLLTNILLLALMILCIIYQNKISQALLSSLYRCVTRVIPSLFAMTVLSSIIQKCGLVDRIFAKTKFDSKALSCLIFGNIGGYPIGAQNITDLVSAKSINLKTAENVICFSFSCGPSFAVGVSYALYGSSTCGFAAFISIFVSNLIVFIFYLLKNRETDKLPITFCEFTSRLVVDSVMNAANAMFKITAMIAAFAVFTEVLKCVFPNIFIWFIPSVFEISNIIEHNYIPLPLLTALLAFGGLCVQMQIVSIVNSAFKLSKFFLTRVIQIPLAVSISLVIDRIFKLSNSIITSTNRVHLSQSNSIIPLICMLSMVSIIFLASKKQRTA